VGLTATMCPASTTTWTGRANFLAPEGSTTVTSVITIRPGTDAGRRTANTRSAASATPSDTARVLRLISSPVEPVRHLDQEGVRGMRFEQLVEVTGQRARALEGLEVLPPLRPHEVQ